MSAALKVTNAGANLPRLALASLLLFGVVPAVAGSVDLSRYREFQLGTDLAAVVKLTSASSSEVKTTHSRPALIQELEWRPQPLGWSSKTETVQEVIFSFCNGALFKIAVNYDQNQTEGLTTDDIVGPISATYGMASRPPAALAGAQETYADQEEILARWEDPKYRFDLIRSSYGPTYRLVGILKSLDAQARTAITDATRLDGQEAPQREAARLASEEDALKAELEKARLANKPNFRP